MTETDDQIRIKLERFEPGGGRPDGPAKPAASFRPVLRPPVAVLTVCDDGRPDGEVIRLRADRFVIGRTDGDLRIPHDLLISARHAEVTRQPVGDTYRWVVTDLNSAHGLFVRVSKTRLRDGTEFLIGGGRYRFEANAPLTAETIELPVADDGPAGTAGTAMWAPAPGTGPALIEVAASRVLARFPLVAVTEMWIGSDPGCTIRRSGDRFTDPRHARLVRSSRGWKVEHSHTRNGLWLRMPEIRIERGERCQFQIGEQRFRLDAE